jgi:hypothetical protein
MDLAGSAGRAAQPTPSDACSRHGLSSYACRKPLAQCAAARAAGALAAR